MNESATTPRQLHSRLRPLALGIAACLGATALSLHAEPRIDALRERVADGRLVLPARLLGLMDEAQMPSTPAPAATTRVVTNCDDAGTGSLRGTIDVADSDDTI